MIGDFEVKYEDLAARIGLLETRHGKIETPAFFPVVNPLKTEITINDIKNVGFNTFITNSYIIRKNYGKIGKIHDYFKTNDFVIMTDSGAYQILQYGEVDVNNLEIVSYEAEIEPDIAVFLDIPTGNERDEEKARYSVEETLRRGEEALPIVEHTKDSIIWVHPIQGGNHLDLLSYSAKEADKREAYRMLALGSPTVLMQEYNYDDLIDMIFTARLNISRGKPLHLFGGGVPHLIPLAVSLGVDSFDSASYILYARDDRYISRGRVYRLEDLEYFPCSCPVCSRYTPKELLEMSKEERTRLLAIHNLYAIKEEISATKQAIYEGRLFEYLQEKSRVHPALYSAFKKLLKYAEYLEKYDPRTRGEVKGVLMFDQDSFKRPEVIRHDRFMQKRPQSNSNIAVIFCWKKFDKPYFSDIKIKKIIEEIKSADFYVFMPFYGLVPLEVSGSFPYSQTEFPNELDDEVLAQTINKVKDFLKKRMYKEVRVIGCEGISHVDSLGATVE